MSKTLKKGDSGHLVNFVQTFLNVYPDGQFGDLTEEAVKDFQTLHGLKADGIVGEKTLAALQGYDGVLDTAVRRINEIIVHCTATPEGKDYTVDTLRQWHKQRGFSDVGYHFIVHPDGRLEAGRSIDIAGAHCVGHNVHSIGVCYIGGLDSNGQPKDTRTKEQRIALKTLLVSLRIIYRQAPIYGHCDFAAKACPCFDARKEYLNL